MHTKDAYFKISDLSVRYLMPPCSLKVGFIFAPTLKKMLKKDAGSCDLARKFFSANLAFPSEILQYDYCDYIDSPEGQEYVQIFFSCTIDDVKAREICEDLVYILDNFILKMLLIRDKSLTEIKEETL